MRLAALPLLWIWIPATLLRDEKEHAKAGDALVRRAEEIRIGKDVDPQKVLDLLDQAAREYGRAGAWGPVAVRSPVNEGYRWAAGVYEGRGEWERALAVWERWKPVTWCGNEGDSMRDERLGNVAICQARLGRYDDALATLEQAELGGGPDRETFLYLEFAARAGRLAAAKERLRSRAPFESAPEIVEPAPFPVSEEGHDPYRTAIRLVEAYDARDPAGILLALEPEGVYGADWARPQPYIFAGRYLAELGPSALAFVAKKIEEGNPRAFKVAGFTGREELAPALEARSRTETYAYRTALIDEALWSLRAKEVPASGPESRPSGDAR